MHPTITGEIVAAHIAELHRQAARQRPARQLRIRSAVSPGNGRVRAGWARLGFRRPRLAAA